MTTPDPARALHDYAWALDTRDWAALEATFAADACADFPGYRGEVRGGAAVAATLRTVVEPLDRTQHLITNVRVVTTDRQRAVVTACYQALHIRAACKPSVCTVAGFYTVTLEQVDDRWCITSFTPDVVAVTGNDAVLRHVFASLP